MAKTMLTIDKSVPLHSGMPMVKNGRPTAGKPASIAPTVLSSHANASDSWCGTPF